MSNASGSSGRGPKKRLRLPRQRKTYRCDFRVDVYSKLKAMATVYPDGKRQPLIEVIERLILDAETPRGKTQ